MAEYKGIAKFGSDGTTPFSFPEGFAPKLLREQYEGFPYLSLISKASYQSVNTANGTSITFLRSRRPEGIACDAACPTGLINDTITTTFDGCIKFVEKFSCRDLKRLNAYGESTNTWLADAQNEAKEYNAEQFMKAIFTRKVVTNSYSSAPGIVQGGATANNTYDIAKPETILEAIRVDIEKLERNKNIYKKRYSRSQFTILLSAKLAGAITTYLTGQMSCCDAPNVLGDYFMKLWNTRVIIVPELDDESAGNPFGLTDVINWAIIMDGSMLVWQSTPCTINNPIGCSPEFYIGFEYEYGAAILKPEQVLINVGPATT